MINLEKIKQQQCHPHSSPPSFKKTCPCTILPLPFFNVSDSSPSEGGNQNSLPPLKKGGVRTIYIYILYYVYIFIYIYIYIYIYKHGINMDILSSKFQKLLCSLCIYTNKIYYRIMVTLFPILIIVVKIHSYSHIFTSSPLVPVQNHSLPPRLLSLSTFPDSQCI